ALGDLFSSFLEPRVAAGATAMVAAMLVFSISLLLQGPLIGVALQSHNERKDLIGEFGRRAVGQFKGLVVLCFATFVISMLAMTAWMTSVVALGWLSELLCGFIGLLVFVVGSALTGIAAVGATLRFAIASPALLVEKIGAMDALRR